jgi:hypothetical protein
LGEPTVSLHVMPEEKVYRLNKRLGVDRQLLTVSEP